MLIQQSGDTLTSLNSDALKALILNKFTQELSNLIPGINAERVFNVFDKDRKLVGVSDYINYYSKKKGKIDSIQICQHYIDYVYNLYLKSPSTFFRIEKYLEDYLVERMKYFGVDVDRQVAKTDRKYGYCVVDLYCPGKGVLIELKTNTYKRNRFCSALQVERYESVFDAPCLLLYADRVHEFEQLFFSDNIPVRELLDKF